MIYLRPGSDESFDTRWMRRTWAASALLTGPLAGSLHSQDMINDVWFLPWRLDYVYFLHETDAYLNTSNADLWGLLLNRLVTASLLFGLFTSPLLLFRGKALLRVSVQ